ncbi:MAG TPA: pyridoxamine 5'-phosphate oxidase [Paenalcaligenes hominis]|uniref:Pyridoxine/pyridoxamine 5'-phosphate oxidase n=1 Tax=Paenalcaligenes hominis TaxID=643674 RepID=A0A9D3AB86_9BURK|nr:pyridoxamine 5'-phosphate oxidase [Paenalcaligenes hominis]NJB66221.1 pyridoxamine 5'-phosphate oxidase [Paenalcaligenes hominis]GGE74182.1 pyridoxine/pyridoxamine 5'-phosphate oxidase [Paenalcaligenes hominis]HJH24245.1 pyridoxamine 5'-phosphate oxidase [Paenalcaligenes hominis]
MSLADYRNEYDKFDLPEHLLTADPKALFTQWVDEAIRLQAPEPTAMSLSTVAPSGQPSSRIVLLKGYDSEGVLFYTNYDSKKGHDLAQNPQACLLFFWPTLQRQIRLEGTVHKASAQASADYFASRPLASKISALASPQSQPITRVALEQRRDEMTAQYGDNPPCPDNWGGYYLVPTQIEFWQGRTCRLHDRFVYTQHNGQWEIQRLAP